MNIYLTFSSISSSNLLIHAEIEEFNSLSLRVADESSQVMKRVDKLKLRAIGQYCKLENELENRDLHEKKLNQKIQDMTKTLMRIRNHNTSLERLIQDQKETIENFEN